MPSHINKPLFSVDLGQGKNTHETHPPEKNKITFQTRVLRHHFKQTLPQVTATASTPHSWESFYFFSGKATPNFARTTELTDGQPRTERDRGKAFTRLFHTRNDEPISTGKSNKTKRRKKESFFSRGAARAGKTRNARGQLRTGTERK